MASHSPGSDSNYPDDKVPASWHCAGWEGSSHRQSLAPRPASHSQCSSWGWSEVLGGCEDPWAQVGQQHGPSSSHTHLRGRDERHIRALPVPHPASPMTSREGPPRTRMSSVPSPTAALRPRASARQLLSSSSYQLPGHRAAVKVLQLSQAMLCPQAAYQSPTRSWAGQQRATACPVLCHLQRSSPPASLETHPGQTGCGPCQLHALSTQVSRPRWVWPGRAGMEDFDLSLSAVLGLPGKLPIPCPPRETPSQGQSKQPMGPH